MTKLLTWLHALHAEILRLKRTLALRLVFIAPLPVVLLAGFVVWEKSAENPAVDLWDTLIKISLGAWSLFMLPLLIALITALLNSLDHNDKIWKHLFALPVPRSVVYLTRLFVSHLLLAVSTIVLVALIIGAGWILMRGRTVLANAGAPPVGSLFKNTAQIWLSAGLIIAVHHWISIRWAAFTVSLGAGIAGTFFALFASGVSVGRYFPWLLPANVLSPEVAALSLWLGIGGGLAVALLGCATFVRRDVG